MQRKWLLEVRPEGEKKDGFTIHLSLAGTTSSAAIDVVSVCGSLEQFRAELGNLKKELDQMLLEAEAQIQDLTAGSPMTGSPESDPESVWKSMQACPSPEEMFDHFNAFDENAREQIADYILGHANMFKGWGPVFAEHYDRDSHRLEA
jgi:hypothetical protein